MKQEKGTAKMRGKRKFYTPEFKFKVVRESFQRDTTIEEVCRKFDVPSSVVSRWRQEFQQNGPEVFADKRNPITRAQAQGYAPGESPDDLKKLIGDVAVQNELPKKSRRLLPGLVSKQHRVALARTLCASGKPINKSQLVKLLGIARSSLYLKPKRPKLDKALAVEIEHWQEQDDTIGHRKFTVLRKHGQEPRQTRDAQIWLGCSSQTQKICLSKQSHADSSQSGSGVRTRQRAIGSLFRYLRSASGRLLAAPQLLCPLQADAPDLGHGLRLSYEG
ncbi:MAG: transposase [Ktedonobacteraceae bacterium]